MPLFGGEIACVVLVYSTPQSFASVAVSVPGNMNWCLAPCLQPSTREYIMAALSDVANKHAEPS